MPSSPGVLAADPALADRFRLVRYEDIAARPRESRKGTRRLSRFALRSTNARPGSGERTIWARGAGNSSYDDAVPGISDAPIARWRDRLPAATIRARRVFLRTGDGARRLSARSRPTR